MGSSSSLVVTSTGETTGRVCFTSLGDADNLNTFDEGGLLCDLECSCCIVLLLAAYRIQLSLRVIIRCSSKGVGLAKDISCSEPVGDCLADMMLAVVADLCVSFAVFVLVFSTARLKYI